MTDYTANRDSCTAGTPQVWSDKSVASTLGLLPLRHGRGSVAVVLHQGKTAEPQQRPTDSITVLLNFFDKLRGPKAGQ